jgi:hypothetical protein
VKMGGRAGIRGRPHRRAIHRHHLPRDQYPGSRHCRMSKWNPIISDGRGLAAPGDLSRRWCSDVGSRPCHRVAANGFNPGRYRGAMLSPSGVPALRRCGRGPAWRRLQPHPCARKLQA